MIARITTIAAIAFTAIAAAAPPVIDVNPARPLFVFSGPDRGALPGDQHAVLCAEVWGQLPEFARPYSLLSFDATIGSPLLQDGGQFLSMLRFDQVPVSLTVSDGTAAGTLSIERLNDVLAANSNVFAIHIRDLKLSPEDSFAGIGPGEATPVARWLTRAIDLASAHGRLVTVELDTLTWLRIVSDPKFRPLANTFARYRENLIGIHAMEARNPHTADSALTGLWLEGTLGNWGSVISQHWYLEQTDYNRPGVLGARDGIEGMPPALYNAQVLAKAVNGATVYRFGTDDDLWFGSRNFAWSESIEPVLRDLIALGAISRRDLIHRAAPAAYQCGTPDAPVSLEALIADVDASLGAGPYQRYFGGITRVRAAPSPILGRSTAFPIPILSAYAPPELVEQFDLIIRPGSLRTKDDWAIAASGLPPNREGFATTVRVGRSVYIFHNRPDRYQLQEFAIDEMPAPVRGLRAQRTAQGVELSWPFRENDFSYTVHRRIFPDTQFQEIASGIDVRNYLDTGLPLGETAAYALTALTNEAEPYSGTVNWGDYRVVSTAVSRIEEEVVVHPDTEIATATPVAIVDRGFPDAQPVWPAIDGLEEQDTLHALAVAERLEVFQAAVQLNDRELIRGLYDEGYVGADGSNAAFVRAFWDSFLNRYPDARLHVQAQRWTVRDEVAPRVTVQLYVLLSGVDWNSGEPRLRLFPEKGQRIVTLEFELRDGRWRILGADPAFPATADAFN